VDILQGDKKKNDELLKRYFATHLLMETDGKKYDLSYLVYENGKEDYSLHDEREKTKLQVTITGKEGGIYNELAIARI
jgi:hypothetical protein